MRNVENAKFPGLDRMWRILKRGECEMLDSAACRILQEMGVHIDDKDCIEYLKDTPCEIDKEKLIVKFPEYWIKEMIRKAPTQYVLAGREKAQDRYVSSCQKDFYGYFTSGATKMYEWDDNTKIWTSRYPKEADVQRAYRMVDAIDMYDGCWGTMVEDVEKTNEGRPAELHTLMNKYRFFTKHGGPHVITEGGLAEWEYVGKLTAEVMGGYDEIAKRAPIGGLPTCIGPLTSTRQNFWAAVGSAKLHLPTYPYWGGTGPFTAPATIGGQTILAMACCHYGMAVQMYLDPGSATVPWPCCTPTDPATGQLALTDNFCLVAGMGCQVYQDLYNLPTSQCSYCLTGPIDEIGLTWMYTTLMQSLQGNNIIQFGSTPQAFMFETIPMGESIMGLVKALIKDLTNNALNFDDEHLALDMIIENGPEKLFTTKPHTLKWIDPKMGLFWHSDDLLHDHADRWLEKGGKLWHETCRERLSEIDKHEPVPIAKDIDERCKKILEQADEELAIF